jgi:hypothetical protein
METAKQSRVVRKQTPFDVSDLRFHALRDLKHTAKANRSKPIEIESLDNLPDLPLKSVMSLQAVAMGVLRENARRPRSRNRFHQFTLFENSGSPIGSNDVDRFVSIRTGMVDFRTWRLSVSFLEYILSEKLRYSNTRDLYQIEWDASGQARGTELTIVNYNPVIDSYPHPETQAATDKVLPLGSSWRRPLYPEGLEEIKERMLDTALQFDAARIISEEAA